MSQSISARPYRAVFILDTRDLQESVDALMQKVKDSITTLQGKVVASENLGMREFSRATDRKFPSGHYLQVDFDGVPALPAAIKERFRLDKSVDRIFIETR
jgi:small subunit ribosomal protein S6